MTFSDKYRLPVWCAVAWMLFLVLACSSTPDMGEGIQVLLGQAVPTFLILLVLIPLRRLAKPSRLDLLIIALGLPILFLLLLLLSPLVWHLRGNRP